MYASLCKGAREEKRGKEMEQEKILFMHTMSPGCDFRLVAPLVPNSTIIDTRMFLEHPSREE